VAHVTHDSDTTFKVRKSKVKVTRPLCSRCVDASGGCSGGRGNVLAVGNCCYVAVCSAAQGASVLTGGGERRGHIVAAARLQLVILSFSADVLLIKYSLHFLVSSFIVTSVEI